MTLRTVGLVQIALRPHRHGYVGDPTVLWPSTWHVVGGSTAQNTRGPRAGSVFHSGAGALFLRLLAYLAVIGFSFGPFLVGGAPGTLIHLGGANIRGIAIRPEPVANMIDPMIRTISAHQRTFSTSSGANGATEAASLTSGPASGVSSEPDAAGCTMEGPLGRGGIRSLP